MERREPMASMTSTAASLQQTPATIAPRLDAEQGELSAFRQCAIVGPVAANLGGWEMARAVRALMVVFAFALAGAVIWPAHGSADNPAAVPAQLPGIGIAAHRPVFGGACKTCPWGVVADVVKAALVPYGYDVQICYHCFMADAPRIVGDARMPPPWNPHMGGAVIPDSFIPEPPNGRVEFGAVSDQFLIAAYHGTGA